MRRFIVVAFLSVILPLLAKAQDKVSANYVPSIQRGSKLYMDNCAVCHGGKGFSDTLVASTLKKKPAILGDPTILGQLSPQRVFDVLTRGVPENDMPSYRRLTEAERWDVAAFVFTLNCNFQKPVSNIHSSLPWLETKNQTDLEIMETLQKRGVPDMYVQQELAAVRSLLE